MPAMLHGLALTTAGLVMNGVRGAETARPRAAGGDIGARMFRVVDTAAAASAASAALVAAAAAAVAAAAAAATAVAAAEEDEAKDEVLYFMTPHRWS